MFQQKNRKKPPPRPPPPNLLKLKSKSSFNLTQGTPNLIEWSPPSSPKAEKTRQFGGSVSSSYSSSTSSLTSSKKSLENDTSLLNLNFSPTTTTLNWISNSKNAQKDKSPVRPRIIRPLPPKKSNDNGPDSGSLPMPKIPPPSPPKGNCDVVTPYGVALYDFPGAQSGDLSFQTGEVIFLIRRVNSEWLYGKICDTEREGIFPANFIQVEVPLSGEDRFLTALYEFSPQMEGDLPLKAGQRVKVIREISDEWLFGETDGRTGQFPRNFVS